MTYAQIKHAVTEMYLACLSGGEPAALQAFENLRRSGQIDALNVERVMFAYRARMSRI